MIRNYFIIAWRNLLRNKLYSFINIFGLAIGIACCVLIYLFVQNELSYDRFNEKAGSIYRLTLDVHQPKEDIESAATAPLMGPAIQAEFPEILKCVRITLPVERYFSYKEKKIYDNKIIFSDSTLFDVFSFKMRQGDPKTALVAPYSIVLTESMAKKYFGTEAALGKTIKNRENNDLTITGIIEDVPKNSHFNFEAVLSRNTLVDMNKNDSLWLRDYENNWYWIFQYTYFLLDKNCNEKVLESKISAFTEKQYPERRKNSGLWYSGKLQALKDIHLKSAMDREINPNSDIKYIYIFSGTALLILLIACFNFINLSTARSLNRSKEIGLRKVVGASRYQLVYQFLGESMLFTLLACACSFAIVSLTLPYFNSLTGLELIAGADIIPMYVLIIFAVGLFSGFYPALLISSFKPVKALKGHIRHGWQDLFFRKGLVVFQFCIAIVLIAGTQIISEQLNFVQNKKIGIDKEQMLQLYFRKAEKSVQETFLRSVQGDANIVSASLNSFNFRDIPAIPMISEGEEQKGYNAQPVILIDENFLKTFQLDLISGRNISKTFPTDEETAFLVNETAVRSFGWKSPQLALGKKIQWAGAKSGQVIGVVKDFNYASLRQNIRPLVMHVFPQMRNAVTIRVNSQNIPEAISSIETKWKQIFPDVPFTYTFMQEDFEAMYKSEQKLANILSLFTALSILVACLGLFGLAAFSIKQRVREIGIRKVLGASVTGIAQLLSKDFLKLVLVAAIIAIPIAGFLSNKWLEDFAYKININWWIFISAGLLSVTIALLTVSFQAIKAARNNPVKSIRTE